MKCLAGFTRQAWRASLALIPLWILLLLWLWQLRVSGEWAQQAVSSWSETRRQHDESSWMDVLWRVARMGNDWWQSAGAQRRAGMVRSSSDSHSLLPPSTTASTVGSSSSTPFIDHQFANVLSMLPWLPMTEPISKFASIVTEGFSSGSVPAWTLFCHFSMWWMRTQLALL